MTNKTFLRKGCLTAALFIMFSGLSVAQSLINLSYGTGFSGRSLRLRHEFVPIKGFTFCYGLKYHVNNPNKVDSRDFTFKNRFYAPRFLNHFGFTGQIGRVIFRSKTHGWHIGAFLDVDLNYLGLNGWSYYTFDERDPVEGTIYYRFTTNVLPFFSSDLSLGLNLYHALTSSLFLQLQVGFGGMVIGPIKYQIYDPTTNELYDIRDPWTVDWPGEQVRIGLGYRISKPDRPNNTPIEQGQ